MKRISLLLLLLGCATIQSANIASNNQKLLLQAQKLIRLDKFGVVTTFTNPSSKMDEWSGKTRSETVKEDAVNAEEFLHFAATRMLTPQMEKEKVWINKGRDASRVLWSEHLQKVINANPEKYSYIGVPKKVFIRKPDVKSGLGGNIYSVVAETIIPVDPVKFYEKEKAEKMTTQVNEFAKEVGFVDWGFNNSNIMYSDHGKIYFIDTETGSFGAAGTGKTKPTAKECLKYPRIIKGLNVVNYIEDDYHRLLKGGELD